MKKIVLAMGLLISATSFAQSLEELKAKKAEKDAAIAKLKGEAGALQAKIDSYPGWKFGAFGTIGANLSGFKDWYSNAIPNSSAGNIGITGNAFAKLDRDSYFWKNDLNINLGWVKIDNKDIHTDDDDFKAATDVFSVSSLFGYKLSKSWAVSTLAEYRTSLIENFNNPGYLDVGLGATWTPIQELVVVIHPLNYNFVFSKSGVDYDSSMGAKIVAEYNKNFGQLKFRSNLSTFQSYKDSDLSNWTWINSLGFNIWKGIGIGLESGLRYNKQESFNYLVKEQPSLVLKDTDTKLQHYWLVGLSYAF